MQNVLSVLITLSLVILPFNVNAYIDPGTGTFVLQMLFASLIGGLFTIKMYFQKVKNFFKGIKSEPVTNQKKNDIEDE